MSSISARIVASVLFAGIVGISAFGATVIMHEMQGGYCIAHTVTGGPCAANPVGDAVHHLTAAQSFLMSVLPMSGALALFLSAVITLCVLSLAIFRTDSRTGGGIRPLDSSHSLQPRVLRWLALHENSPA